MLKALVAAACVANIALVATAFYDRHRRASLAEEAAAASAANAAKCRSEIAAAARAYQPAFAARSAACLDAGVDVEAEYRAAAVALRESAPRRR